MSKRRQTVTCYVGGVPVGSAHPIVVQSMTNTDTADAAATAVQVAQLARAGSEIVRITVNNSAAAKAVPELQLEKAYKQAYISAVIQGKHVAEVVRLATSF